MYLKKTSLVLTTLYFFLLSAPATAGNVKIAFVDMRRALHETEQGKAAMKKLTKMKNKLQKKIEQKEKKVMDMKNIIEKQQNVLTKEALQKKAQEYYSAVTELQQMYMQLQKELASSEAKLTQDILVRMEKILSQMGKSDGYTMIFDRSSGAVVWSPTHLDLTDKLIQLYNKKYPKKKKK